MSDKDLNPDDFNADDMHFSEEELEAAMAGFEREFNEAEAAKQRESQAEKTDDDSDAADVLNAAQSSLQFEDELQGLLGNRAKTAVIITRLTSPQLLAAFCQISDISAQCVGSEQGRRHTAQSGWRRSRGGRQGHHHGGGRYASDPRGEPCGQA